MIWLWFAIVQLVQILAAVTGWIVLSIPCVMRAWEVSSVPSVKDGVRVIDRWKWSWLNYVYGNPEDGVSGIQAVVWSNEIPGPYLPTWPPALRAYFWSALRNSCDALKYTFANEKGPLKNIQIGPLVVKVGWQSENGYNVPVLSVRRAN